MRKNNLKIIQVNNGFLEFPMTIRFRNRLLKFLKRCQIEAHNSKGEEALVGKILKEINRLFGQGASQKIFKNEDVTIGEVAQFLSGLTDLIEKWGKEGMRWQ